jgi:hypothetical protein
MSVIGNQPSNPNFLSPLGFNFSINRLPTTTFFLQNVNVPNVTLGELALPTPFKRIPIPGDQIEYGELSLQFRVDEDMTNYREIYDWIVGLGSPDNFGQYKALKDNDSLPGSGTGILSDATLTILTSAQNPNIELRFKDIFPTSLSDFSLSYSGTDVEYVLATADFKFLNYTIVAL